MKTYIISVHVNLLHRKYRLEQLMNIPERTSYKVPISPFTITKRNMVGAISKPFYLLLETRLYI